MKNSAGAIWRSVVRMEESVKTVFLFGSAIPPMEMLLQVNYEANWGWDWIANFQVGPAVLPKLEFIFRLSVPLEKWTLWKDPTGM